MGQNESANILHRQMIQRLEEETGPNEEEQLANLFDALGESLLEEPDEEILKECRDMGSDPAEVATNLRRLLLEAADKNRGREE